MKSVNFTHGHIRATSMRFAIAAGRHIRLKDGVLQDGSLVVEGEWKKAKALVTIFLVENGMLVKVGRDYEARRKLEILQTVKCKLLDMPAKMGMFAAEIAWRSIMARKALE